MIWLGGEERIQCVSMEGRVKSVAALYVQDGFHLWYPIHLQFRLFVSNDYDNQLITTNHCTLSKRMAFTLFLTMNSVTFWIEGKEYPYPCDDTQCINDYIDSLSVNLVPQFNEQKYGVDKTTNYRFWNGRDYCPLDKPLGALASTPSNSIVVCLVKQGMCTLNGKSTSFWYYTSFQYGRALESALKALGESRSADLFELQDDTGVHKSTEYVPLNGFPDLHHFEIVCKADQPIPKEESKNQPVPKEESKNQQNPDPSTIPVSIQFKETKKSFSFPVNTVIKTVVDKASKVRILFLL